MGENEKQGKSQKKRLVVILIMLIVFIVLAIVFVSCRSVSKDRKKDSENSSEESMLEDDVSAEESLEAVNSQEGNVTSSEKESDVFSGNNESESDESHTDASTSQVADDEVDEPEDTQSSGNNDSETSTSTTESVNTSDEETTQHQHTWVAQYTIVHHEEEGHHEDVVVQEAYDEPIYEYHYFCNYCELDLDNEGTDPDTHCTLCGPELSEDDPRRLAGFMTEGSSWRTEKVVVDTIHHDAVYETQWIVDKAAYDEKVLTGYTCTCGATKSN